MLSVQPSKMQIYDGRERGKSHALGDDAPVEVIKFSARHGFRVRVHGWFFRAMGRSSVGTFRLPDSPLPMDPMPNGHRVAAARTTWRTVCANGLCPLGQQSIPSGPAEVAARSFATGCLTAGWPGCGGRTPPA